METIIRGDTSFIDFKLTDQDGNPLDLTGKEIYFTLKKNKRQSDEDALIKKDFTFEGSGVSGEVEIELSTEDTDLPMGIYVYDLQVEGEDYLYSTPSGKIKVVTDVTQRTGS
jgi:hypothetical protein